MGPNSPLRLRRLSRPIGFQRRAGFTHTTRASARRYYRRRRHRRGRPGRRSCLLRVRLRYPNRSKKNGSFGSFASFGACRRYVRLGGTLRKCRFAVDGVALTMMVMNTTAQRATALITHSTRSMQSIAQLGGRARALLHHVLQRHTGPTPLTLRGMAPQNMPALEFSVLSSPVCFGVPEWSKRTGLSP
jgi:hypothetical protein